MAVTTVPHFNPLTMEKVGTLMRRSLTEPDRESINREALEIIMSGEFARYVERILEGPGKTIFIEGVDGTGKSTLAKSMAALLEARPYSSSDTSNAMLEDLGFPVSKDKTIKPTLFSTNGGKPLNILFFVLANLKTLETAERENPEGISVIDAFAYRSLAAHKAAYEMRKSMDQDCNRAIDEVEALVTGNILENKDGRKFIFLYATPEARVVHLQGKADANFVDANASLALLSEWHLHGYETVLRNVGVAVRSVCSLAGSENHSIDMPNTTKITETGDQTRDLSIKLSLLSSFLRSDFAAA